MSLVTFFPIGINQVSVQSDSKLLFLVRYTLSGEWRYREKKPQLLAS